MDNESDDRLIIIQDTNESKTRKILTRKQRSSHQNLIAMIASMTDQIKKFCNRHHTQRIHPKAQDLTTVVSANKRAHTIGRWTFYKNWYNGGLSTHDIGSQKLYELLINK